MKLTNKTDFIVMPANTNYMNIIFGGFFMSELDKAAATVVNRAVRESDSVDKAVTFKFNVEFSKPSFAGDIITIESEIANFGKKSILVKQKAYRESREKADKELVAIADVVFVTMKGNEYVKHNLTIEE